jgi:hypothetical protein
VAVGATVGGGLAVGIGEGVTDEDAAITAGGNVVTGLAEGDTT